MTANEALKNHFRSIPVKERATLTRDFIVQLGVTAKTVQNWRYSVTAIRPVYRREISRIIGKDIFSEVTD